MNIEQSVSLILKWDPRIANFAIFQSKIPELNSQSWDCNHLGLSYVVSFYTNFLLVCWSIFIGFYWLYAEKQYFCFDIWRVTNADYLLTYLLTY